MFIISKSLLLFSEKEIINSLIISGYLFVLSIVIVYLSFIVEIPVISQIVLDHIFRFPGWFQTIEVFGIKYTQIYFQVTLILSTLSIIAFTEKRKFPFYLFTLILLLTLSKFGIVTIMIFIILIKYLEIYL